MFRYAPYLPALLMDFCLGTLITNTSFFSDGSIFRHIPNACAFLPSATPPADLAAVVGHYGDTPPPLAQTDRS